MIPSAGFGGRLRHFWAIRRMKKQCRNTPGAPARAVKPVGAEENGVSAARNAGLDRGIAACSEDCSSVTTEDCSGARE